ncbi:MAG: winged helix-turn-helix domain-containing protein [Burkholderiaceae bacterium]
MNTNRLSHVAGLIGEPARTAMLVSLMDGRALTAQELARAAGVTAPTASRHLALLVDAGLVAMWPQGRHRYHRLASDEVARTIEGLMHLAQAQPVRPVACGPQDRALRQARTCYDHIAGRLGVEVALHLAERGAVELSEDGARVQPQHLGEALGRIGMDLPSAPSQRPLCRACMDWSERRLHVSGVLGAALCAHWLAQGWLARTQGSRALRITPPGAIGLRNWLGTAGWERVVQD